LPTCDRSDTDFLITAAAEPAWPARSDAEISGLTRLASVFGSVVKRVDATPGALNGGPEEVVALGLDAEEPGRLYAHLSVRTFRLARTLDALVDRALPAVVVTTPDHLTIELLDALYPESARQAPGIVCGEPGPALRRQVLLRSAAAALGGPVSGPRVDFFPTIGLDVMRAGHHEVLGGRASVAARRDALTRGAGVVAVMTHCDGVDAFLGEGLAVCAMDRVPPNANERFAPRCRITGLCHRHERTMADAYDSAAILTPEAIAARVLVWDVCFGVMPIGSTVDPGWGIGARLVDSAAVGAILTTWQIVLSSPEHSARMSRDVARGVPVGRVLARFNRSQTSRERRHRMCLLGDPRVRLPRRDSPLAQPASERTRATRRVRPPASSETLLLRLCMSEAAARDPGKTVSAAAQRAREAIERVEWDTWKGAPGGGLSGPLGNAMRAEVLEYAYCRGKLLEAWMPYARSLRAVARSTCTACGRPTDVIKATMRPPGVADRRISICPLCGVVEDVPLSFDLRIELSGLAVKVHGQMPRHCWTGGVLLASSLQADHVRVAWPRDLDQAPSTAADLPSRWPIGPLRLSAIFIWDAQFAVLSRMTRSSDPCAEGSTM
jgi:hypothetical protein